MNTVDYPFQTFPLELWKMGDRIKARYPECPDEYFNKWIVSDRHGEIVLITDDYQLALDRHDECKAERLQPDLF